MSWEYSIKIMAESMPGIKNSWSLVAFARMKGSPKLAKGLVNKQTGETFDSLAFVSHNGETTFCFFSSKLGTLTAQQIKQDADNLQVAQLESGSFCLCRKGYNSWEDIDIL